jgi:hypothetical protein
MPMPIPRPMPMPIPFPILFPGYTGVTDLRFGLVGRCRCVA